MMKVAIFGNDYHHAHHSQVLRLRDLLERHGADYRFEVSFARSVEDDLPTFSPNGALQVDYVLSLGGDGTFLTAVMHAATAGIPIMGINMGHLGYLTAYGIDDVDQAVADLTTGHFRIEDRTMLTVACDACSIDYPYALNDIAILRRDTSSTIEMLTTLRGVPLTTYKGDGLVVCTPTGSTAYNLSAGGPILEPSAASLVLTPVSPHTLNMRPIVVGDDSTITITTRSRSDSYQVSLDGEGISCPSGSTVTIAKAPFKARVIQRIGGSFAEVIRHKLLWGTSGR